MSNFGWMMITIMVLIVAIAWSENHDKKVMESANQYEKCVIAEYGVGPANWYEAHGEYPTCPAQ